MSAALLVGPDAGPAPEFDDGWLTPGARPAAYLSYAQFDGTVNWSAELEAFHEEASRSHFLDVWTRQAIMERLGNLTGQMTLLDLGCSTGHLLMDLRARLPGATLYGVDLVGEGLDKAHAFVPDARLLQADARELPLGDQSMDAVASANLMEHVLEDGRVLDEVARILRPGGRAAIVVPAGPSTYDYYDRFLGHERRYARGELAAKARQAGFDVLEDAYLGSFLYPAFWLIKQRNRRRFTHLQGPDLERRVAADVAHTRSSELGQFSCTLERRLLARGVRLPFGIRNIVSLHRC